MAEAPQPITSMGWEPLPYGCVGLVRSTAVTSGRHVWSWLILIPWATRDGKPWIDGTRIVENPMLDEDGQRADVLAHMREILDQRYGASVAGRAVESLIERLRDEP